MGPGFLRRPHGNLGAHRTTAATPSHSGPCCPSTVARPLPVADPGALRRQWYGSTIFEVACDTPGPTTIASATDGYLYCQGVPGGELSIGGKPVGNVMNVHSIGITH